ncbi:GntR family transcriptional regulator [Lichenifustis flavocetrariae]|uniref:GntR family transcriptional regulator n=1 Tax=Lichenifustis flavocetrariae TaxID=2949735 RepID=A0AA41Z2R1_9HYPH|nr:GntR family transcriptional regulator [Lichenifustis flavocetrariae]MCW6509280.1 GntR family transcriptional regulator [Lichenifustis flavocetrariae]
MFSKTDHAYESLRRNILDGHLQPGQRLRLSHLAKELDLSEMPIREALRLLQRDGLVVMHLHRGAEVAQLSFQHSWNIEEVRLHLEARACLSAAPFHDDASCGRMEHFLSEMKKEIERPVVLARINRNFHTELMSLAPNAFLREHVQELWDRAWQLSSASFFEFMPHRMSRLPIEGSEILACVRSRNLARLDMVLQARIADLTEAWPAAAAAYERRALALSVPA